MVASDGLKSQGRHGRACTHRINTRKPAGNGALEYAFADGSELEVFIVFSDDALRDKLAANFLFWPSLARRRIVIN